MCPRGPRRQLGGTRYRTMSRWSEMVTSVTMSGTIMAQRSDFSDQRSFRVTASEIYKWRHLIENFFCKLKEFKRIAMRADKTDQSFAANILLAAARKDGTDFQLGRKTQRKRMKAKLREIIAHRPWRAGCGRRVDISGSSLADTKGASIGVPPSFRKRSRGSARGRIPLKTTSWSRVSPKPRLARATTKTMTMRQRSYPNDPRRPPPGL
jgi:hypothetical protein